MQRPNLVWRPDLDTVLENPDCDNATVAFSSVRVTERFSDLAVCSSLTAQNAEMHEAMETAVYSLRHFPRPGLVCNMEY